MMPVLVTNVCLGPLPLFVFHVVFIFCHTYFRLVFHHRKASLAGYTYYALRGRVNEDRINPLAYPYTASSFPSYRCFSTSSTSTRGDLHAHDGPFVISSHITHHSSAYVVSRACRSHLFVWRAPVHADFWEGKLVDKKGAYTRFLFFWKEKKHEALCSLHVYIWSLTGNRVRRQLKT